MGKFPTRFCTHWVGNGGKHFWHHKDCKCTRASVVQKKSSKTVWGIGCLDEIAGLLLLQNWRVWEKKG